MRQGLPPSSTLRAGAAAGAPLLLTPGRTEKRALKGSSVCDRQHDNALATVRLASSGSVRGSERRPGSEGNSREGTRGAL